MDWNGMDGELLIKFIPYSARKRVQNIILNDGSAIGEWKRFVILPAKIKQKYTLGTTFTNQNHEDQFISIKNLLKYDETRKQQEQEIIVNGDSVAEIDVCEQRKFWITPRNENTILLNDIKIESRTELKFEDYLYIEYLIVIGKRATRQQRKIKEQITFLFFPRQTNPKAFTLSDFGAEEAERLLNEDKRDKAKAKQEAKIIQQLLGKKNDRNLIFTPGQNGLILSIIFSHLSLRHVKNARFVSKFWAEEGAKQLRKRAWVHFDFYTKTFDNDTIIGMKLFRYDFDVKNSSSGFGLSNTVLSLPRFGDDIDPSPMNKLLMDLDWIFNPQNPHRFKKIKLQMDKMTFDNVVKVLTIISPFMEELEFDGVWEWDTIDGNDVEFKCNFPTNDYFSKVKKISVSVGGYGNMWNGFKTLISAMKLKNVKEIDLKCYSDLDMECLDCFNSCDFEGKQISVNLPWFNQEELFVFLLSSKFNQPLKKFILEESLDVKSVPIFQQVLFKHCKTLEVLSFRTPYLSDEWKLQLPIFEKLKVLNIDFYNRDNVVKNDHFLFDDGTGNKMELDYNRYFPCLQSLTLGTKLDSDSKITKHWKECYSIYKVLFPFLPATYEQLDVEHKEEKLFKTLVYLKIPFENCPQRMEMIARNVPNVHNKWLNPIRQKLMEKKS